MGCRDEIFFQVRYNIAQKKLPETGELFQNLKKRFLFSSYTFSQYRHYIVQAFNNTTLDKKYFFFTRAAYHQFAILQSGDDRSMVVQYFEESKRTRQGNWCSFAFVNFFIWSKDL